MSGNVTITHYCVCKSRAPRFSCLCRAKGRRGNQWPDWNMDCCAHDCSAQGFISLVWAARKWLQVENIPGVFEHSRSVVLNKQPSSVKVFKLGAHLSACFSVSHFLPSSSRVALVFKNRSRLADPFPAAPGFVGSCFCGSSQGWKLIHPLPWALLWVPAPPLAQQYTAACDKTQGGGGWGGCYYPRECIQVACGPQPECWPTSLTLFFSCLNEIWHQ